MSDTINAIVARERDGKVTGRLEQLAVSELPDEGVLVRISHSTLNYKDGLAVSGRGRICRRLPMVCGIDLAGEVLETRDERFSAGDRVLVNGYELSEKHWGGYAQQQRLAGDWLVPIPGAFSTEQAMALGTAGYTAMLAVHAIEDAGISPEDGPALVTGATGGVGAVSVLLLSRLGYHVTGATGKPDGASFLKSLGAAEIIGRDELARESRPLESETWAAGVDFGGRKHSGHRAGANAPRRPGCGGGACRRLQAACHRHAVHPARRDLARHRLGHGPAGSAPARMERACGTHRSRTTGPNLPDGAHVGAAFPGERHP